MYMRHPAASRASLKRGFNDRPRVVWQLIKARDGWDVVRGL